MCSIYSVILSKNMFLVNGGWGFWGDYGDCMNGVKARYRQCDDPPPSQGGKGCPGNNMDTENCPGKF